MNIQLNKTYLFTSIILFITEVLITSFYTTGFIRHTFGDYLVVIFLYCLIKSFVNTKSIYVAIGILAFSFIIEILQHFNLLKLLNLEENTLAKLILGSTFHISDLVAYTLGIATVLIIEYKLKNHE